MFSQGPSSQTRISGVQRFPLTLKGSNYVYQHKPRQLQIRNLSWKRVGIVHHIPSQSSSHFSEHFNLVANALRGLEPLDLGK